jgi:hypothetical protein
MKEGAFESIGRYLLGLLAAASFLELVLAGTSVLSFRSTAKVTAAQSERIALESAPAKEEKRRQLVLEQKVGECYSQGGVARLDPLSGYTGCDLPVPKSGRR